MVEPPETSGSERQRELTRREFARQAAGFERPGSIFRDEELLDWICDCLPPIDPEALVLDVAGGTGQLGRRLARGAALATVIDLTAEMLAEGVRAIREQASAPGNVVFVRGDATALPLPDAQFDLVVSRFAWHHIDDPAAAAREMARVCRPGGTVATIDMAREPGPDGERHDALERLRDPSHHGALTERELLDALAQAGVAPAVLGERRHRMALEPWLAQAKPGEHEREQVRAAVRTEARAGQPTGLHGAADAAGELSIEQRWLIVGGPRG